MSDAMKAANRIMEYAKTYNFIEFPIVTANDVTITERNGNTVYLYQYGNIEFVAWYGGRLGWTCKYTS